MRARLLLFLVVLVIAVPAAIAGGKPDFSGTWTLDKSRSRLEVEQWAKMDHGVAVIQHNEPRFKLTRTFTTGGKHDSISFEFLTDGKEVAGGESGMKTISLIRWEGDSLVFITRFILPDKEATNIVRYTLLDGGKTLQADEKFNGPKLQYHNVWIFEKQ